MAIAFVQKTAQFFATAASSVGSGTLSTTAGNTGILSIAHWVASGSAAPTITDSKGNAGVVDKSTVDTGVGTTRASIGNIPLVSAGAGHSWTINLQAGSYCEGNVCEFSGLHASPFDQSGGAPYSNTASTLLLSTDGATEIDFREVVIACICNNTGTTNSHVSDPPTSGYTSIGVQVNNQVTIGYEAAYKEIAGTAVQSATWNFDSAYYGVASIATYKEGAGAPPVVVSSLKTLGPGTYQPPMAGLF